MLNIIFKTVNKLDKNEEEVSCTYIRNLRLLLFRLDEVSMRFDRIWKASLTVQFQFQLFRMHDSI